MLNLPNKHACRLAHHSNGRSPCCRAEEVLAAEEYCTSLTTMVGGDEPWQSDNNQRPPVSACSGHTERATLRVLGIGKLPLSEGSRAERQLFRSCERVLTICRLRTYRQPTTAFDWVAGMPGESRIARMGALAQRQAERESALVLEPFQSRVSNNGEATGAAETGSSLPAIAGRHGRPSSCCMTDRPRRGCHRYLRHLASLA